MPAHLDKIDFARYIKAVDQCVTMKPEGRISQVVGLIAQGDSVGLGIGGLCSIINGQGKKILSEVVGFKKEQALFMPYGDIRGVSLGSRIIPVASSQKVGVSDHLLGRIIDGMGNPIDGKGDIEITHEYDLFGQPIGPMDREQIKQPLDVGVAAINSMITLGKGQRMAIMAGSGVG
ncbi:MAG: flagellum-specific ATP synthase FliI, partial [Proteobacteria bacterium]|nr:flagellum-specific ATP synthase FliI [Pseudomonadota bacterium]